LDDYQVIHDDVQHLTRYVPARSLSLILTDPPYHRTAVPLYGTLAEVAAQTLKPGGSLVAMLGQSYLPAILASMTPHLNYHWLLSLRLTGAGTAVWARRVQNHWRALVWFVQGKYTGGFQGDLLRGDGADKRYHPWGQGIRTFAELIGRLTEPGALVCDPFCGGGTTGKAALLLGRRFLGLDTDAHMVNTSHTRLQHVTIADTVQDTLILPDVMPLMRICLYCRRLFPGQRASAEYCSPAHRQAAYRDRRDIARGTVTVA
jgi:hypothetical protein